MAVARHTHPGIESAYVLEGGFELPIHGQPTRTIKPGDGFQIPPEMPHAGGKPGDTESRILITYVVEKGKTTRISSLTLVKLGALCFISSPQRFALIEGSRTMKMSIIRKGAILASCLVAIGAWTVPSKAASESFKVTLTGAQQVPPVDTAATGTAELTYDPATRVLTWNVSYSGLSGPATMAHFHGPAAQGKNGPPVIWLSPKGSPVEAPIKGEATLTPEQAQQFTAGEWYINVHTQDHQAGEIRGQVLPPKS